MTPGRALGDRGEDAAVAHLAGLGWRILERNYRCRWGELDAVALEGRTVCFIEVKTAPAGSPVTPEERVTADKQKAVRAAARRYLHARRIAEDAVTVRFDVVAVRMDGDRAEVRVYKGAF